MKGVINENIADMLNLPPLEDALREQGVEIPTAKVSDPEEAEVQRTVAAVHEATAKMAMLDGSDHADAMDDLHREILGHARDLMSYGFNLDHPRARGIFEIAASMYAHAITAKNSKRDNQLRAMKLAMDNRRVDLEEKRTNHVIGQVAAIGSSDTILVEDRNELLRQMRQQAQAASANDGDHFNN